MNRIRQCPYFRAVDEDNFTYFNKKDCVNCLHYRLKKCKDSSFDEIGELDFI